ncbi:sulfatase-like hydrolase/transferase [Culicoidibacter larvae]|uniref:Sulfatase N-terminal domain-containing protein n=1 Tax=Culicoidibacter larvae TaxID=2579976 RepID=A0A5R8QGE7_9FIRM|nr:sulfatase-like hydrolase/transferase [Culicoidibacter larvae]TLG77109.1 hypothetical protein FEZ08_00390 [Culicoidibacter larvae]
MNNNKDKHRLFLILITILTFVTIFVVGFTTWMVYNFGDVSFEQYFFSITAPTAGTPTSFYIQIAMAIGVILLVTLIVVFIYYLILKKVKLKSSVKKLSILLITGALLFSSLFYMNANLKIATYFFAETTTFFEDNYVKPSSDIITFPKQKKNLIYIYLESFEATYFSKELGGAVDINLMPNLTALINEPGAVSFSGGELMGGGIQAPETGYSIAGMFAQQSGLPFKVPVKGNDYGTKYEFATGAITLGDILKQEGYNLQFLVGADGTFAGVNNFYQTHGDFEILDVKVAKDEGKIPQEYLVWWGFEDRKLFEFSREKLEAITQQDQPFAMVIEADDSHFPDGYTDEACPKDRTEPYENSISCVDSMVGEFINYLKQQPYYEDTVIVLHGDHLSMEQEYFKTLDPNYERRTFNAYLNLDQTKVAGVKNKDRLFNSMDVFPTVLSAMNVDIKGNRLGLGTDLFSGQQTLYEKFGTDFVNAELAKKSPYFFETFLYSKTKYE